MAVENFEEFLSEFRGDDLSYALKQLELPVSGSKSDKVSRIIKLYEGSDGLSIKNVLSAFRADDVKLAADKSGILN
ncbi:MAG: hypothetical protein CL734_05955 [Chloroflexi bacterium]|nr:hypothetical protein [Chloroflexota bacterium]